jgi:hypothetical protein
VCVFLKRNVRRYAFRFVGKGSGTRADGAVRAALRDELRQRERQQRQQWCDVVERCQLGRGPTDICLCRFRFVFGVRFFKKNNVRLVWFKQANEQSLPFALLNALAAAGTVDATDLFGT